ncbi:class I poly(R)-hydroxyalkanoic acid synthase [Brevirhabdus pacifica]|uniref:Class I poly(R)-hydroxyalkanoic acid synthase n=1 Tax=Brevirhabdus pacifica TaxID=1267768 RepID=A0A1U7DG04_9RHOB|nr:class I poly(R)-hydroxyalkanoic acid synthase [Brevirhabdus pacifica]APX88927.1 class I poly(R)-hydroxyalkanoic acid synthase [Brevirhabdus pacifica]OWU80155.1 poly(R)-hydroxyalkanoic acid synthase [Loktanella sp. 22II-4b]PJJ86523.1 polyhydroxyalkanoate synthase [Brevirhabdus pacifica]
MATEEPADLRDVETLNANLAKVEELSQRLVAAMAARKPSDKGLEGPGQDLYAKAASAYMSEMMANPARIIEHQVGYWGKALKHFVEANHALASMTPGAFPGAIPGAEAGAAGPSGAPADPGPKDRRFSNPLWDTHPYFNFIKQQYQLSAEAIETSVRELEVEGRDKQRLEFFARQIIDMMSPANFLATNPEALEKAVATNGQSLVQGLENLVRDIEANDGELLVSLSDRDAFTVGENLAATEGSVVYRNSMFELIQYAPATEKVRARPLILFPPWINKFYVLDLKPRNSLIRWIVEQGYTLFVVSWVNPDPSYRDVGLETYVEDGFLEAIRVVREITGEEQVNATGYCIAGTTLALSLALLKQRGEAPVASATFFTTLTDFSDKGEVGVFLTDDFVDAIEREVTEKGILQSFFMSRTFSYLRSNDLIYQPAIRSYMLGEAPPAFDLLYWNGDSTNLPARMAVQYLRGLCQGNRFAEGGFDLAGTSLALGDVDLPVFAVACETDHIAAWPSSYVGVATMGSKDKTFVLSQSGHIAGIVNPPSKNKYGHYTGDAPGGSRKGRAGQGGGLTPEEWKAGAEFHEGSWWGRWEEWLRARSGDEVPARQPGSADYPVLCPAPGTYVVAKPRKEAP